MFKKPQLCSALTRSVSASLALLVLFLNMALVSPQVHQALHTDSADQSHACSEHSHDDAPANDCDHSCAVALFGQGAIPLQPLVELPERTDVIIAIVPQSAEIVWCGQALIRRCSRAPPIETIV
ncbi:MAG: hypothetical protein HOO08_09435 [Opitutae bacterium]|nr:hypothetical protein [Opitutae bacterium]